MPPLICHAPGFDKVLPDLQPVHSSRSRNLAQLFLVSFLFPRLLIFLFVLAAPAAPPALYRLAPARLPRRRGRKRLIFIYIVFFSLFVF